ncbi:pickpocket protein 28-like [Sabethes cyaneus]|uniref:pickpocket protein 28-like n=1 Tax=Sabethes cyaneus TaxID=53552 RepID=UPI00237E1035|nr:pickpocket protein 28-like [Sabethes cyaneus]
MIHEERIHIYQRDFIRKFQSIAAPPPKIPSKWTRIRTGLGDLFREFCANSTIHGISYIGSKRQSVCEKFWWILVILMSLYGCGNLIDNIYRKWEENPVIITFDEKHTPVWEIPFPAVTICPEAKVKKTFLNFTESFYKFARGNHFSDINNTELDAVLAVLQLCDEWFHTSAECCKAYDNFKISENIVSILKKISFNMNETIYHCQMNGVVCKAKFAQTITEEGICMTFNGFSSEEMFRKSTLHTDYEYLSETRLSTNWSLERGYYSNANLNSYPIRVLGSGFGAGLYINLATTNTDLDYHCREAQGFKVLLHSPSDYPQVSKKFIRVTLNRDVTIAIKPQIIGTDNELHDYSPDRRLCFFDRERELKFFHVYSQGNCELECLTNFTEKTCGCVRYFMPRTNQTRSCETFEIGCTLKAQIKLLEINAISSINRQADSEHNCNCLPACNSIQYDAEITQTIFKYQETLRLRLGPINVSYEDAIKSKHLSKIEIYFKDVQFITSKRTELYGLTDFVASCGGILGLCMGVSLLSLIELLYFCSIRPLLLVKNTFQRY